jgi:glycerol-1-phosphate dehydrogenase [NAD(P)+]
MEIAGSSRPASGSEHLISHALDEILVTPKMHGIQVGVSAYLCALLQENENIDAVKSGLVSTGFFDFVKKDPFGKKEYLEALKLAPTIKQDYYTILSEKDYFSKAEQFINNDELLKQIIVG